MMSASTERRCKVFKGDNSPNPDDRAPEAADATPDDTATAGETMTTIDARDSLAGSEPLDLAQIDAELAREGDDLLESSFASVEDLLGDSFDADEPSQPEAEVSCPAKEVAAESSEGDGTVEAADETQVAEKEDDREVSETTSAAASVPERDEVVSTDRTREPESIAHADTHPAATLGRRARAAAACALKSQIRAVLPIFGWPLRFVPERFRPVVDWLALSLVFWVPVVWIVVFVVTGR